MVIRPFCFIHAGEFHLEQPLHGVSEVPDHLRNLLLEAPFMAACRMFDAALSKEANFIVLCGDLVDHTISGPRGPLLLVEQFQRLAERSIPIYWVGSPSDAPQTWPATIKLPPNVHFFSREEVEYLLVSDRNGPLVRIAGLSAGKHHFRADDFLPDPVGLFTIAAAYGCWDTGPQFESAVHYWALGGRHSPGAPNGTPTFVRYCGTIQGRMPSESGVHGCFLVQVDEQAHVHATLLSTDVVRWVDQRVEFDETTTAEELEELLHRRIAPLREAMPEMPLLISWTLTGRGRLRNCLRREQLTQKVLSQLRAEYGRVDPPCWSVGIKCEPPKASPNELYAEETIRGDFLKAIHYFQSNLEQLSSLEAYLPEGLHDKLAAENLAGDADHHALLCEAAELGLELLTGEDAHR